MEHCVYYGVGSILTVIIKDYFDHFGRRMVRYAIYGVSQKSSPPKTFCGIFSPCEPV